MPQPFDELPRSLRERARLERLGPSGVPALIAHPDWQTPVPYVLWMHGRTAHKELDPGRYNRWLRAGIGCCAIDLPGHGERADPGRQVQAAALGVIAEALGEIDGVVGALIGRHGGVFTAERAGIGGMSMGGMIALRRLCDPHRFRCAAVEGTTGDLGRLYRPRPGDGAEPWPVEHPPELVRSLSALEHLEGFMPVPLLAMHSRTDGMVAYPGQAGFIEALRGRYVRAGADPGLVELVSWERTGAPLEHVGFGEHANEAKNRQTAFLSRYLLGALETGAGE